MVYYKFLLFVAGHDEVHYLVLDVSFCLEMVCSIGERDERGKEENEGASWLTLNEK